LSGPAPLAGRRILITRAEHQAGELAAALRARGAEPLFLPGLAVHPPNTFAPVDEALERLDQFDWITFTSQNAVDAFVARATTAGKNVSGSHLAAVGAKTARALEAHGLIADLVPGEATAEALAAALVPRVRGCRILWPRAQEARDLLAETLRQAGATEVCIVPVYRAEAATPANEATVARDLARGAIDGVTFASARTVQAVLSRLGDLLGDAAIACLQRCRIFSIGPVTSAACRAAGLERVVEAHPHTIEGMVESIVEEFRRAALPPS